MRTPRDPSSVLALGSDATFDEARAAYRRLAEIFHPDRFADARPDIQAEAERQMKDLNGAWRIMRARFGHADEAGVDPIGRTRAGTPRDRAAAWGTGDDFSTRARQARTRQRAQERRASTPGERVRAERAGPDPAAERDAVIREARRRLLREEAVGRADQVTGPGD